MEFIVKNQFAVPGDQKSIPGTFEEQDYKLTIDDNGTEVLVANGFINVDEKIQSFKDETDINKLLKRYEAGDVRALNIKPVSNGNYGDFSDSPKSLAEAFDIYKKAAANYNKKLAEEQAKITKDEEVKKDE